MTSAALRVYMKKSFAALHDYCENGGSAVKDFVVYPQSEANLKAFSKNEGSAATYFAIYTHVL